MASTLAPEEEIGVALVIDKTKELMNREDCEITWCQQLK